MAVCLFCLFYVAIFQWWRFTVCFIWSQTSVLFICLVSCGVKCKNFESVTILTSFQSTDIYPLGQFKLERRKLYKVQWKAPQKRRLFCESHVNGHFPLNTSFSIKLCVECLIPFSTWSGIALAMLHVWFIQLLITYRIVTNIEHCPWAHCRWVASLRISLYNYRADSADWWHNINMSLCHTQTNHRQIPFKIMCLGKQHCITKLLAFTWAPFVAHLQQTGSTALAERRYR